MKKKTISLTALLLSLSILLGGCGKSDKNKDSDETANVITQSGAESSDSESRNTQTMSSEEYSQMWDEFNGETTAKQELVINTVDYTTRYGYNSLSDDEKALYKAILEAAQTCTFKINVTDKVTTDIWAKIYGMVFNQEPQLFYMNPKIKVGKIYFNENDPVLIAKMQGQIDETVNKVLSEAKDKPTTAEKLKVFHDYIVLNNNFGLKDNEAGYNSTIYSAFYHGEGSDDLQCAGYAKAMQYLCDQAGIESMVVTGANKDGATHAWNVVNVDGAWYNLDTTWDDPILKTVDPANIRYNYLLVSDSWTREISHFKINQLKLSTGTVTYFAPPACTETKENYFVRNNKVYSDTAAAEKAIKDALLEASKNKAHTAQIMVSSKDVYDALQDKVLDYNTWIKENGSNNIKGIANNSNAAMMIVELDIIYN